MSFPSYPEYKDSCVEWLGEVPGHWELMRLKRIAAIQYGIGEPPKYHEDGTPLIPGLFNADQIALYARM